MSNANDNGSGNAATPEEEEDDGEIQMEEASPNELFRLDVEPAAHSEENSVEIDAEGEGDGDGDGDGEDDDDVAPEDDSNGDDAANADADDDPAADRRSAAKKELTQIIDKWEQEQTQSGYDPVPTIRR